METLGLYVSVPFCRAKCTYCNFASGVSSAGAHQQYVDRLCAEIRKVQQRLAVRDAAIPQQVDTIYLGGGTPGMLSPPLIDQLARTLRQEFSIAPGAEITLESAPGQLDEPTLQAMLALGVNRISFGVQSLVDREASATGRSHTRATVLRDLESMRAAGLTNLSIDLIAGLPHQTAASWQESLEVLAATGVDHASIYMLEIDEDSRLGRELLAGGARYHASTVPSEDLTADLYESAVTFLESQGLRQYEISNFARPGLQSRHNRKYWQRKPYLGFGLDAHSMLRTRNGAALRFYNPENLGEYLGAGRDDPRSLSVAEELEEALFLGLRLNEGVSRQDLSKEFGSDRVMAFEPVVQELCDLGLLIDDGVVRLSRRGLLFSNEVFARFLAEQPRELIEIR